MAATGTVEVASSGDATVFTVIPARARRFGGYFWTGLVLLAGGGYLRYVATTPAYVQVAGKLAFGAYAAMIAGLAFVVLGLRDRRPRELRRRSVIRVSPEGFQVNGRPFPRLHTKRLFVRDPMRPEKVRRTVTFIPPGTASVATPSQLQHEREWDALGEGTYEILLDADHEDQVIARNLDGDAADRLLRGLYEASGIPCHRS